MIENKKYEMLLANITDEIKGFKIVKFQDSRFIRTVHFLVKIITLFKFDPGKSRFTTTIGKVMYVPNDWDRAGDKSRYKILRHELVHLRQFRRWPFPFLDLPVLRIVNVFLFSFCYLFVAIPGVWSLRAKFEREAYTQSMLSAHELVGGFSVHQRLDYTEFMGEIFGGPSYFWMWRRRAAVHWAMQTMLDVELGNITNDRDRID